MSVSILVDTAPLVGLLSQDDQHHTKSELVFAQVKPPLFTTWPVLTEAAWMLRADHASVLAMLDLVITGFLEVPELDDLVTKRVGEILTQYRSLGLQLADATLIHLAEQLNTTRIITFDERDFRVVCLEDGRHFEIVTG